MIMQRMSKLVLSLIFVALCAGTALATPTVQRESGDFNFKYEGDVYPLPNYLEMAGWEEPPTTDGDIFSYQSTIESPLGYFKNTAEWGLNVFDYLGWTLEMRLKIDDDAEEGSVGVINICMNDDTASNQWGILRLSKDNITYWDWVPESTPRFPHDSTDDYHTYRIAQQPSSGTFICWVDDQFLCDWTSTRTISSEKYFYFGDAAPTMGGPTVNIDYIRFDSTGAYAPVPEPSVVVLLLGMIAGAFCLLRRR